MENSSFISVQRWLLANFSLIYVRAFNHRRSQHPKAHSHITDNYSRRMECVSVAGMNNSNFVFFFFLFEVSQVRGGDKSSPHDLTFCLHLSPLRVFLCFILKIFISPLVSRTLSLVCLFYHCYHLCRVNFHNFGNLFEDRNKMWWYAQCACVTKKKSAVEKLKF